ncbi:MAG: ChbG/HpnK family deacetylase [Erysipelotrichaceae bacterium]|nr:ChbG/HpnK family deacetylase [Erysipelotrichaceae bacterium]
MRLLTQGDDYGFTRAVTDGIVDSIDFGFLRNTGIFTNMPSAEYAVSFMKDRPQACFGIDFNIVAGKPLSDPATVKHLVDENGWFIKSGAALRNPLYATEEGRRQLYPYDEVYRELRAQYDRFVELTGKKPGFLHAHSLQHEHYNEAIQQISKEEGIPYSMELLEELNFKRIMPVSEASNTKQFNAEAQLTKDAVKYVIEALKECGPNDDVHLICHPGYVDAPLLTMTSLSLERAKDAEMYQSQEIIQWLKDNNVELITYYDLYK